MDMWAQRRYGILAHTSIAAVPAWAPVGEYADWYAAHLEGLLPEPMLHRTPLVETLAHHRDHWPHIEHFDEFIDQLSFADFDAEAWSSLATDAGMNYAVTMAKHHDGFCWWDTPATSRNAVEHGPRRNIFGELTDVFRRSGFVVGASYSLLDWHDGRYGSEAYVNKVIHPQVLDLVTRYDIDLLWGNGHWGHGASHWRSEELLDQARTINPSLIVNDRWWADHHDVTTFKYQIPDEILSTPWETSRALGLSFGHNTAERHRHLLDRDGVISLLTEVVAKGGRLLLSLGADSVGRLNTAHASILRAAGRWVGRHQDLINRGRPWERWGDAGTRYLMLDDGLHGIDIAADGRLAQLRPASHRVTDIRDDAGSSVPFAQTDDGVQILGRPTPTSDGPTVYRIAVETPDMAVQLFGPTEAVERSLAEAIVGATSGQIVQLGEGRYRGPANLPPGVTLRGLGADRTELVVDDSGPILVEADGRLEHCRIAVTVDRIAWLPNPAVTLTGDRASLLACRVAGHVGIEHANDVRITSCSLSGLIARNADRVHVARSVFRGMGWDCAIDIEGGAGHLVESNEISGYLQAIRLVSTVDTVVRGNQIAARWWGVHLADTEATLVVANFIAHTMRAVDVDGGRASVVTGNAVDGGDSGCVVQRGATDAEVSGNHWHSTRVGLIVWEVQVLSHHDNTIIDLGDPDGALITGP